MKHFSEFCVYSFLFFSMVITGCNLAVYTAASSYIYDDAADVPTVVAALIPGAAISSKGELSSVFRARVDSAILLYREGKVTKILVSGDNSTLTHNEVNPARDYLIKKGIPDADIFLDHAGFDTYSSMYRARDIFGITSLIVTTQSFHLPRSVFIARRLGMEAYGVRSDIPHLSPRNYVREAFATEKAVLDLIFQRTPKFLGDEIPIRGDGKNYP